MICYKDKTYCTNENCSNFDNCEMALTEKVYQDARKWWGTDNPPIAVGEFDCEVENEK